MAAQHSIVVDTATGSSTSRSHRTLTICPCHPDRCAPIEIFPILPCRRLAVLSAKSPKNRYLSTLLILLPMQRARQRAETAHFTACETQGRCCNRKV
jgi:hypothetical protein